MPFKKKKATINTKDFNKAVISMQKCDITGKGKQYGHNVSFSLRRTNKVWKPNLQTKTVTVDGKKVKLKVSTAAIRTLRKKGLL